MTTITDVDRLNQIALAASADRVVRWAVAMERPYLATPDLVVAWHGDRGFFTNFAYVLRRPNSWTDLLSRVAEVVPAGRPVSLVSALEVPDLADHGWQLVGHPPLMVRSAGPTGAGAAELTITEVADGTSLEVFERTLVDGYPDPSLQPYRWGQLYDERILGGATHLFTGWVDGRPVATAGGHVTEGVNLVEFVATAAAARGRGYGAALTVAASTVAPMLPAVLIASDLGRPVYERLGFVEVHRWTFWHRPS